MAIINYTICITLPQREGGRERVSLLGIERQRVGSMQ